jgi:hypothetical protein
MTRVITAHHFVPADATLLPDTQLRTQPSSFATPVHVYRYNPISGLHIYRYKSSSRTTNSFGVGSTRQHHHLIQGNAVESASVNQHPQNVPILPNGINTYRSTIRDDTSRSATRTTPTFALAGPVALMFVTTQASLDRQAARPPAPTVTARSAHAQTSSRTPRQAGTRPTAPKVTA